MVTGIWRRSSKERATVRLIAHQVNFLMRRSCCGCRCDPPKLPTRWSTWNPYCTSPYKVWHTVYTPSDTVVHMQGICRPRTQCGVCFPLDERLLLARTSTRSVREAPSRTGPGWPRRVPTMSWKRPPSPQVWRCNRRQLCTTKPQRLVHVRPTVPSWPTCWPFMSAAITLRRTPRKRAPEAGQG